VDIAPSSRKAGSILRGYSHPVEFPIPEGIQITVEKQTHLTVQAPIAAASASFGRHPLAASADPYSKKGFAFRERLKKKPERPERQDRRLTPGAALRLVAIAASCWAGSATGARRRK